MGKRISWAFGALLLLCAACNKQPFERISQGFRAEGDLAKLEVICYAPDIVFVSKAPLYSHEAPVPTASVVMEAEPLHFSVEALPDRRIRLSTDSLRVEADLATCTFSFFRADGTPLLREAVEPISHEEIHQGFVLDPDEAIYGLGQHKGSGLNQRGRSYHLENVNTEIAIPLVHSIKGYALYWDNYAPTEFVSNAEGFSFSSGAGENCRYFLLGGGSADAVVRNIRRLTGQAPLNPLWSFGFLQSRERYTSQEELLETLRRYRALRVPLDGIIQDWQYWGDHAHWNAVEFLNPAFPDPAAMLEEVHALGAHAMISVWPSFGPETAIFRALASESLLLGQSTFPQGFGVRVYNPWQSRARDILWQFMQTHLWDAGIDAWWLDATEPEHQPVEEADYDFETGLGSYRMMRNSFPLYSVGGVYDHQRALTQERRVLILTRSATAGLQRFGAHVWSGDLVSSWESLHDQIASALHLSLCGIPYHNSDIGGFFSAETYPGGVANPGFRQLYDRWMQLAVFTGMMRSHGTHTPREIFQFGQPGDPDYDMQAQAIRLRYLLLPYLYAQAWRVHDEAASLMRPLFADYPDDPACRDLDGEFLFGDRLLVAPVTRSDDSLSLYLPEGNWIHFWSGERLNGGVRFRREVPRDEIPVYVKAGTILPVGPEVQYVNEKPWDDLQIRIYVGADGDFCLYEDAGDGYAYEHGAYSRIPFHWDDRKGQLSIGRREGTFPGMLTERDFRIVIVRPDGGIGLDDRSYDEEVRYHGNPMTIDLN